MRWGEPSKNHYQTWLISRTKYCYLIIKQLEFQEQKWGLNRLTTKKKVYQQKLACEATLGKHVSNKHAGGWMNNHEVGIVGIFDNKCGNINRETLHVTSAKIHVEDDNIFFYALPPTHLRLRFIILTTIALAVPVGISIHCIPILVAEKSQYWCPTP